MNQVNSKHKKKSPIICRCNNISEFTIKEAIREGCTTLNEIFDETQAGVGPCGGSCRRKIGPMLEGYLKLGRFPEDKVIENSETSELEDSQCKNELKKIEPK
jgi:bacterioferritin-associated ferredoxin